MLAQTVLLNRVRRTGLLVLLLLMVSGLAATASSACNSGWSRSPNDNKHYWAGADAVTSYTANGIDGHIYTTNPTVPDKTGTQGSSAWVGMYDQLAPHPYVLVQLGLQKLKNTSVPTTFYQINVGGTIYWTGQSLNQNLTVGNTYDYNVYYQGSSGGTTYFDFAGAQKAAVAMSNIGVTWLDNSLPWFGQANGEVQSYADQMPGTTLNEEIFSTLQGKALGR